LGAEVGQLSGFGKGAALNRARAGEDPRVGSHQARYILPYLDVVDIEGRADARGPVVTPVQPKRARGPIASRADETLDHGHRSAFDLRPYRVFDFLVGHVE